VLVDSEPIGCRVLAAVLQGHGIACDAASVHRRFVGRNLPSVMRMLAAEDGFVAPDDFATTVREATLTALRTEGVQPVPGIVAALDAIAGAGLVTCVASSGRFEKMRTTLGLTGLLPRFEGRLFSAHQVAEGKPAPDLFLFAATTLGVAPADCVVVEDAPAGLEAARAAGMRAVAYTAAPWSDREVMAALAWRSIDDMAELAALLGLPKPTK
jgi:HAD superfamily hydrolase (TIGR01509 family)